MPSITRRHVLGAALCAPLAACTPPSSAPSPGQSASPSVGASANPTASVGVGKVEAMVFDGAYGTGYVDFAAGIVKKRDSSAIIDVTPVSDIQRSVEQRLADGSPPDLLDNSGAKQLGISSRLEQFENLTSLVDSPNLEGVTIRDTLYHGALDSGMVKDRLVSLNYVLTVYGLWHSATEFAAQGWRLPNAWDDTFELGQAALKQGKKLFVWSPDAANYYQELVITSAIKEGGHDVRRALDNLQPKCWSHPAVTAVLAAIAKCISAEMFVKANTYLAAQELWSVQKQALLYPAGSWIAKEIAASTGKDFGLTVAAVPTISAAPMLPATAIHAAAAEQFMVPAKAKNGAGAKELLRVMLSKETANWFSTNNHALTVVRGAVPADAPSTLQSQTRLLADAGDNTFTWQFPAYYGLIDDQRKAWAQFLGGEISAAVLASELQGITDRAREDGSLEHYTVK